MIHEGLLPLSKSISFDGLALSFEGIHYWVEFYVVREYGNYMLFAGFASGVTGLILRLLFYQKNLRITIEEKAGETTIMIDGKSEYYPYSFLSEMDAIAGEMRGYLAADASLSERAAPRPFLNS